MSGIQKVNQKLPDDFAALLLRFAAEESRERMDSLLANAKTNGWSLAALAEPFDCSREWIRLRVKRSRPMAGLPPIPLPPRIPTPMPVPDRRLRLRGDQVTELREMAAVASTVNGALEPGHPARRVSEQFTAQLAAYVKQGITAYYLGQVLGVTANAITFRLARHGYRAPNPSQASAAYLNRKVGERPLGVCAQGHDMSGDNLRITNPGGARVCRACERVRSAAYRERRRQAETNTKSEVAA